MAWLAAELARPVSGVDRVRSEATVPSLLPGYGKGNNPNFLQKPSKGNPKACQVP